ncbi:MAG: hypothetical protein WDA68_08715 [Phycisphaerae bacterium]
MKLTAEEKEIGNKAILKYEKEAQNWRRHLFVLLILVLLALLGGIFMLIDGFYVGFESAEECIQRYRDEADRLPSGTERDLWMVGTFRKAATILESRFELYKIATAEIVFGLLMTLTGMRGVSIIFIQWNRGPQKLLLAKILRAKWEEEIAKN